MDLILGQHWIAYLWFLSSVAEQRISSCHRVALCSLSYSLIFVVLHVQVLEAGRVIRIDEEQQEAATIAGLAAYRDNQTVY